MAKILFVVTGASYWRLKDGTRHPTGYWAEEFAAPYRELTGAGQSISPKSTKYGLGGRFPGPVTRLVRLIFSSVPGNVDRGTGTHGVASLETRRVVAVNPRQGPRESHTLACYPHIELWGGAVVP